MMKKYLACVCLLLMQISLLAQTVHQPGLSRSRKNLVLNGEKLSTGEKRQILSDIGGESYLLEWQEAEKKYDLQDNMMIFGGVFAAAGLSCTAALVLYYGFGVYGGGAPIGTAAWVSTLVGTAGAVSLGCGIYWRKQLTRRLDTIVDKYNQNSLSQAPLAVLSVGPTPYGVGLQLSF